MLHHFKLDEDEFLRETGATIKYGIRHRDWRRVGVTYDGPIDDPHRWWRAGLPLDTYAVAAGRTVGEAHLFQHLLDKSNARRSPARAARPVPAGPFHHAYHFDQALVGAWLRRKAKGIAVIDDQVQGVETGEGGITAPGAGKRPAGRRRSFRRLHRLSPRADHAAGRRTGSATATCCRVNRAMPFWVDLKEGEEILPATTCLGAEERLAVADPDAGALWLGYVYSDAHTTPDQAKAEIEAALGYEIHPRNDIPINAGRQKDAWIGNCIALGLPARPMPGVPGRTRGGPRRWRGRGYPQSSIGPNPQ